MNDASRNDTVDSIPITDMAAIKKMRQSMAVNLGQQALDNKSVRNSIARASVSFKIADGTEAGDLVIENERLKSTLMILNQKLKVTNDLDSQIDNLNAENKVLREDHAE